MKKKRSNGQPKQDYVLGNACAPLCLFTIQRALNDGDVEELLNTFQYLDETDGGAEIVDDHNWRRRECPDVVAPFDYPAFKQRVLMALDNPGLMRELADELGLVNGEWLRAADILAERYPVENLLDELSEEMEEMVKREQIEAARTV